MNRFTRAVDLLYKAFEEDTLDAMDYRYCAVGNMCHNSHKWVEDEIGNFTDIGKRKPSLEIQEMTGYSASEINSIECLFLYGTSDGNYNNRAFENTLFSDSKKEENRELQFKGLIAVIDYLAQLEDEETPSSIVNKFKACLDAPVIEKYNLALTMPRKKKKIAKKSAILLYSIACGGEGRFTY